MIIFLPKNPYYLFGGTMTPTQSPKLETHPDGLLAIPHLINQEPC